MITLPLAMFVPRVSKLTAYEKPELFDKPEFECMFGDENGSYVLPVCVLATHRTTHVEFLVKDEQKFTSKKNNRESLCFHTVKEANKYIENTLRQRHGNNWMFSLVSLNAI